MTNLFKQLKSKYRKRLVSQTDQYASVSNLIIKFESVKSWTDLTIRDFNSFCTWADINTLDCSISDIKYGDKFIKKTKE